jgi:hypothetical protein
VSSFVTKGDRSLLELHPSLQKEEQQQSILNDPKKFTHSNNNNFNYLNFLQLGLVSQCGLLQKSHKGSQQVPRSMAGM